ncbi:flap endonuclease-1 [Candidatus Micrarchaeota archaeon]|nr:flap endonuclease-1 [Candidatus Micrarchaeota archaeon]
MGVNLGDLAIKHPIQLESLAGKTLAVDAFNTIYQFLSSIRQEDGTPLMDSKGRITAHLSGLFYRTSRLIENGIKPIYVFDGKAPEFKRKTQEERARIKREAEEKWKKALEEERLEDAKKYAQATSRLTREMVAEGMVLLNSLGVATITAPSEGEAQAALMVEHGIVYASASQDYDSLLFGSPLHIRNISITGRRKIPRQDKYIMVEPEEIRLEETLSSLHLNREQLIMIGLLVGTDYNDGVKGVGPKTALKIVSEIKTLDDLKKFVNAKYGDILPENLEEIYAFFLNPPYEQIEKIKFPTLDPEKVKKILCDEHDFDPNRIGNALEKIEKQLKETSSQRKLDEFFK